jgi:hypothetical protein
MILRELFGFIAAPANVWVALLGMILKILACFYVAKVFFNIVERRFLNSSIRVRSLNTATVIGANTSAS